MNNNYFSIYKDNSPYNQPDKENFVDINMWISNIKKCIDLGLEILNNPKFIFHNYIPYLEYINSIKQNKNNKSYIINELFTHNNLIPYISNSIDLLKNDFPDYNDQEQLKQGEILPLENEDNSYNNIEYYENIYRINILTNHILLTNILYILQCKIEEINIMENSTKLNMKDEYIKKLELKNLLLRQNNSKSLEQIDKLTKNIKTTRQSLRNNLSPYGNQSSSLDQLSKSNYKQFTHIEQHTRLQDKKKSEREVDHSDDRHRIKYIKKCLKYYLKSFYLDIENSLKI